MKLTKTQKEKKAQEMARELQSSPYLVFTQYQGLKFRELAELRGKLKFFQAQFRIVKNSLLLHALKQAKILDQESDLLQGPLALVLGKGQDVLPSARVLAQFSKEYPRLKVRAAYSQDRWLDAGQLQTLADLPSREVLLGQVLRAIAGPLQGFLSVLQAPARDLLFVLQAISGQKEPKQEGGKA